MLHRHLNYTGLTLIAIGSCIGVGIFAAPTEVIRQLPHAGWIILVWIIGGGYALSGALTFAELGGSFPKAGGVYVYLREAYGPFVAFLYGWVILLVINTGALAALALIFVNYLQAFLPPLGEAAQLILAASTILVLTAINMIGIGVGDRLTRLLTLTKLLALIGIITAGLLYANAGTPAAENVWSLSIATPDNFVSAFLLGLIGVLFSFGGWHHASYLAGETIEPQRTVPRAMITGAAVVTLIYVCTNLAYLRLLPIEQLQTTDAVARDALLVLLPWGDKLAGGIVAASILGTLVIYTMSAPRIYYAMAKDGVFFKRIGQLHPRYRTPVRAMALQAVWAVVLLYFWGTFGNLIEYVTFMDITFMAAAGAAVFHFRWRRPNLERPYQVWGYPIIPGIFVGISVAFLLNTLIERPVQAGAGLLLVALGSIAYYFFQKSSTT